MVQCTLPTGEAVVTVMIKAYNATRELETRNNSITLGKRVLLACDVAGLPEGNEAVSYRWYHNCTGSHNLECEIQDRDSYYRVVSNTLLVDVTSWTQGGRYHCTVHGLQETQEGVTRKLSVAG